VCFFGVRNAKFTYTSHKHYKKKKFVPSNRDSGKTFAKKFLKRLKILSRSVVPTWRSATHSPYNHQTLHSIFTVFSARSQEGIECGRQRTQTSEMKPTDTVENPEAASSILEHTNKIQIRETGSEM
jgi:hypothetical protein